MEDEIIKLIKKYKIRSAELASEKKYYQAPALLWQTVIQELEEILR